MQSKVRFNINQVDIKNNKIVRNINLCLIRIKRTENDKTFLSTVTKKSFVKRKSLDIKSLEGFDIKLRNQSCKSFFLCDYSKEITVSKMLNTDFGLVYYSRKFNRLNKKNIKNIREDIHFYETACIKREPLIKGFCILSKEILVQIIERLAFSLAELFKMDDITFSCKQMKFNNNFSLYDVPLLKGGIHHRHFDDDLMETHKTKLIKNGIVSEFLTSISLGKFDSYNTYIDEIKKDSKATFTNLYLKVQKGKKTDFYSYYIKDCLMPLKIDLFEGTIEGVVCGIDLKTREKIIGNMKTNYKELLTSMKRVSSYKICQGHKLCDIGIYIK